MIFVQYACELEGGLAKRQVKGLFVACVTVLVYFFSVVYFDYIETVEETNYVDFDVKTITAGDYTVEFDLLEKDGQYNTWKKLYHDPRNPMTEIA